jgi:hypothetical protein
MATLDDDDPKTLEQECLSQEVARPVKYSKSGPKNRKSRPDKGNIHASRSGLLSKHILNALIRSGENLRTIRRQEKTFRALFKPTGAFREAIFDRLWSDYLRLLLLSRIEAAMLAPAEVSGEQAHLREGDPPILLTFPGVNQSLDDPGPDVLRGLALVTRYDAHFARDLNQKAALLILLRDGGDDALLQLLGEQFDANKLHHGGK